MIDSGFLYPVLSSFASIYEIFEPHFRFRLFKCSSRPPIFVKIECKMFWFITIRKSYFSLLVKLSPFNTPIFSTCLCQLSSQSVQSRHRRPHSRSHLPRRTERWRWALWRRSHRPSGLASSAEPPSSPCPPCYRARRSRPRTGSANIRIFFHFYSTANIAHRHIDLA